MQNPCKSIGYRMHLRNALYKNGPLKFTDTPDRFTYSLDECACAPADVRRLNETLLPGLQR